MVGHESSDLCRVLDSPIRSCSDVDIVASTIALPKRKPGVEDAGVTGARCRRCPDVPWRRRRSETPSVGTRTSRAEKKRRRRPGPTGEDDTVQRRRPVTKNGEMMADGQMGIGMNILVPEASVMQVLKRNSQVSRCNWNLPGQKVHGSSCSFLVKAALWRVKR